MKYPKGWAALGIIGALACLVALVVYIATAILFQVEPAKPRPVAPIATTQPAPRPDSFTKMRQAFGPWMIVANTDTSSNHIVLVYSNGSKEVGSKFIRPDSSWRAAVVPYFRDIIPTRYGLIKVRSTDNVVYVFRANQAIVLQSMPETVFAFKTNGKPVSIPAQKLY